MSIEKYFCPSPWLHMRIRANGEMRYCRWSQPDKDHVAANIRDVDPETFFQEHMSPIRQTMLRGEKYPACEDCIVMEQYGKVSGREKQMIKVGIDPDQFKQSFSTNTYVSKFRQSAENNGRTDLLPVDWQIDLGSLCNSACVFCTEKSSSRLRAELFKLGIIDKGKVNDWSGDPALVKKFVNVLANTPRLHYLHFIGGETLMNNGFKIILQELVARGINTECTIGFTTNLTIWDEEINDLLEKFKEVQVGVSIETLTEVNDYLRWPIKINDAKQMLEKYVQLAKSNNWYLTVRTTPTVFSVSRMVSLYEYCAKNKINIESCNFLDKPEFMRPSVLPDNIKQDTVQDLKDFVNRHGSTSKEKNYNSRDRSDTLNVLLTDAEAWITYLSGTTDESYRVNDLVQYIKKLESSRQNKILKYLPEYENFLRSAGY